MIFLSLTQKVLLFVFALGLAQFYYSYNSLDVYRRISVEKLWDYTNGTAEEAVCPIPPNLGKAEVNLTLLPFQEIEKLFPEVGIGGMYAPKECKPRTKVAIIVPYRDRSNHLRIFLNHMHKFLMKQNIQYGIFIIEQADNNPFNRAKLFNVGFVEAPKIKPFDCFIFHDVDLLPIDERNLYLCSDNPRHFAIAIDKNGYRLPYVNNFGGVSGFKKEQFELTNGFANYFWGWGGEDDDSWDRVHYYGFNVSRYPLEIGKYASLNHRVSEKNPKRFKLLEGNNEFFKTDGLNNLKYKVKIVQFKTLYTWILVDLGNASLQT